MNHYELKLTESLPIIPSFHDCEIDNIRIDNNKLIIKLKNLQDYDSITNQNIKNNSCEIVINLIDIDSCDILFGKLKYKRENRLKKYPRYLSGYNLNIYSIDEFVQLFNTNSFSIKINYFLVGWSTIIIKTWSWDYGCIFDLNVESVDIYWYD